MLLLIYLIPGEKMFDKKVTLIFSLLVLAVFAIGSVSASDDIATGSDVPTDDITVDDVSVDETYESEKVVEPTRSTTTYNVDNTTDIQSIISGSTDSIVINFANQTYKNFALTLNNSVTLNGNGAKLIGDGSHDLFTLTGKSNIVISGFIMDINSTTHAAAYGSAVTNVIIKNNTIENGRDGISFFRSYDNVTIEDNIMKNFSRDAISLANPQGTANWDNLVGAIIRNNTISSYRSDDNYGIFIGGAFKGIITQNSISGFKYGMQFLGKPTPSQGKLNATLSYNNITEVETGIDMDHPNVINLYLTHMKFDLIEDADISTGENFGTYTYVGVYNSIFYNGVSLEFYNATGNNKGNNTNFEGLE